MSNLIVFPKPVELSPVQWPEMSPLAKEFERALMSADIDGDDGREEGEIEIAIADALLEYCCIGLAPQFIIKRLTEELIAKGFDPTVEWPRD